MASRRSTDSVSYGGGSEITTENNGAARIVRRAAAANNYYGSPIEVTVKSALFAGQELRISCLERDTVGELKEEIRSKWPVYVRDAIKLYRSSPPVAGAEGGRPVEKKEEEGTDLREDSAGDDGGAAAAEGGRPVEMKDDNACLSEYSVKDGAVIVAEYARADGWRRFRSVS